MDAPVLPVLALAIAAILLVFVQSAWHQAADAGAIAQQNSAVWQAPVAGASPSGEINLTGMDYPGLVKLNVPLDCVMEISPSGEKTTATVSIRGNNTRVDYSSLFAGSRKARMGFIVSGNFGYIYVKEMTSGAAIGRGCDWAKFPANSPCMVTKVDPEFGLAGSLNCTTGNFGDEKFVPSGTVCDMSDRNSPEAIALSSYFPCMDGN